MTVPKNFDDVIYFNSKSKRHGFLSNFYESPLVFAFEGNLLSATCAESAYQAMKVDPHYEEVYLDTVNAIIDSDAITARKLGRKLSSIRPGWDEIRFDVMHDILQVKFAPNTRNLQLLLETGSKQLVHYSPWDTYWGVNADKEGHNQLGRTLMSIRYHHLLLRDLSNGESTVAQEAAEAAMTVDRGYAPPEALIPVAGRRR